MNTPLKKLIIRKVEEYNNNSRRVISFLKKERLWDLITPKFEKDGETLYNYLYSNVKHCPENKIKFVSFSVGYSFCGPANKCNCAKKQVSKNVSKTKGLYSAEKKESINVNRKETNLSRYGYENPFQDKNKIKEAYKEKLGVENPRHIPEVNKKIKETNLRKYGVENPSQNPSIKNKIRKQSNKTYYDSLDKRVNGVVTPLFDLEDYVDTKTFYEWECCSCSETFRDRLINGRTPICRKCNPYSVSSFEKEVREYVESLNLPITLVHNDKSTISPYELDVVVPEKKIAIECNGVYWHSELNGKSKNYHLTKTNKCIEQGIRLLHITDNDWNQKAEIVRSIINAALGNTSVVYARKHKIIKIKFSEKREFLEENHLQGDASSSVNLALIQDDGSIVAVMTFGKSRYNRNVEWELIRYCQIKNTTVAGGPSKLFKHFVDEYKPQNVISYADRSVFTGGMYKKLGFVFSHNSLPGYKYFHRSNTNLLENRVKFQKHKLKEILETFDRDETEWQNMSRNGYDRYWDCGNSVWIWNNPTNLG